jgi:hypothetical protein
MSLKRIVTREVENDEHILFGVSSQRAAEANIR